MNHKSVRLEQAHTLRGHSREIRTVTVLNGQQFALTGADDCRVCLWDLDRGELVRTLGIHRAPVYCVRGAVQGDFALSVSTDGQLIVWDIRTCRRILQQDCPSGDVAFSRDSRSVILGGLCGPIMKLDIESGRLDEYLRPGPDLDFKFCSFSPDGSRALAGAPDGTTEIWNLDTKERLGTVPSRRTTMTGHFTLSGERLVTCSTDGPPAIHDAPDWERALPINLYRELYPKSRPTILHSDNSTLIGTVSPLSQLRVWDRETGMQIHVEAPVRLGYTFEAAVTRDFGQLLILAAGRPTEMTVWSVCVDTLEPVESSAVCLQV